MLDMIFSLAVSIAGGVIVHYIIKWLDSNEDDDQPKRSPWSRHSKGFVHVHMDMIFSFVWVYYII